MSAFPAMPAMPGMPIPNLSAGGGGPSSARTGNMQGGGGFDGSNWAVNFGGQNAVGAGAPPQSVGFVPDAFGQPRMVTAPGIVAAAPGAAVTLSPTLLLILGAALVFGLRRA